MNKTTTDLIQRLRDALEYCMNTLDVMDDEDAYKEEKAALSDAERYLDEVSNG